MHDHRRLSEEICIKYPAQTMFLQNQAFEINLNQIVSGFFFLQKSQRCSKKARISKSGFKKAKLATLS